MDKTTRTADDHPLTIHFWSMTDAERAALTQDDLTDIERKYAIETGIDELVEPVGPMPVRPTCKMETFYRVVGDGYDSIATFRTLADAQDFIATHPVKIGTLGDWTTTDPVKVASDYSRLEITTIEVMVDGDQAAVTRWTALHTAWKKATEEASRTAKSRASQKSEIMDAYDASCAVVRRRAWIASVYAEYLAASGGDAQIARRFLAKRFQDAEITEAIG